MTDFARAHDLMVQVGEMLDLPQVTEFAERQSWLLVTKNNTSVSIELDGDSGRLVLTASAGSPSRDRPTDLETLLVHNLAWRETGGLRFALDQPGGEALLLFDVAMAGLDASQLQALVGDLAAKAAIWRTYLSRSDEAAPPPYAFETMIRV
jgi:Tir chaperone protein (CesT) family